MSPSQVTDILGDPTYRYTQRETDYFVYTYQSPTPLAQDQLRREHSLRMDSYNRNDLVPILQYAIAVRSNAVVQIEMRSTADSYQ